MEKSAEGKHPVKAFGWAARDRSGLLSPFKFSRRAIGYEDVRFKVLYCGICHTDLHRIKNEWGGSNYPLLQLPPHACYSEAWSKCIMVERGKAEIRSWRRKPS
ncbi:unnamed protein product [Camellia sinensis]